jgi:hypothetical protein
MAFEANFILANFNTGPPNTTEKHIALPTHNTHHTLRRQRRQRQHAGIAVARPASAAQEVKEGLTPAAGEETEASRRP